jgi:diguanylate cyclase (GGDEF)-like protein
MESQNLLRSTIYRDRLVQKANEEIAERADLHWQAVETLVRASGSAIVDADAELIRECLKDAADVDASSLLRELRDELSRYGLGVSREDLQGQHALSTSEQNTRVEFLRLQLGNRRREGEAALGEGLPVDRDHLTGLLQRRLLDSELSALLDQAKSSGVPVSVVMIDVDHFKQANDQHGHPKGDVVLGGVARRLMRVAASKGRVYRYGGEEFTIVLLNHTLGEAIAVAERARWSIETESIEGLEVTASFGVAAAPEHGQEREQLIESADQALRDAKIRGRNIVRAVGDPEPVMQQREPERKEPLAGMLSDPERETIRRDYMRTGVARCPRDESMLIVSVDPTGTPSRLWLACKWCGLRDEA